MTKLSEQILQEAFENPNCDGCWGRLQNHIEQLEKEIREANTDILNLKALLANTSSIEIKPFFDGIK